MLLEETHCLVAERVRHVERPVVRRRVRIVPHGHLPGAVQLEIVRAAADQAEVFVESPIRRPVGPALTNVPLARHERRVARFLEHFRDRDAAVVQVALVGRAAAVVDHVPDPRLVSVESGQQRCAGRAAAARVVELSEAQSLRCQRVQVRRRDLAPVASDVGEAHVIGHDDDDVRALAGDGLDAVTAARQGGTTESPEKGTAIRGVLHHAFEYRGTDHRRATAVPRASRRGWLREPGESLSATPDIIVCQCHRSPPSAWTAERP